ncbi:MAG: hypothetical protein HQ559_02330 [Lentisphaerae bacterium]|nr:hypothetical protein [Lentisphaerota bacterium]
MITVITRLWMYFGPVGLLSMAAWLTALVVMARHVRSGMCLRTRKFWIALLAAVIGLLLANVNSARVGNIHVDHSADIKAQEDRGKRRAVRAAAESEAGTEAGTEEAAAEGEPAIGEEPVDGTVETETAEGPTNEYEQAAAEDTPIYAYQEEGQVEREKGKKVRDRALDGATEVDDADKSEARTMLSIHVHRAKHIDRFNMMLAKLAFWLAFASVAIDYGSRFNRTFDNYYPLPASCRVIDALFPKKLSVLMKEIRADALSAYLEQIVRKGETFLYFGNTDPWGAREYGPARLVIEDPLPCLQRKSRELVEGTGVPRDSWPAWLTVAIRRRDLHMFPFRRVVCGGDTTDLTSNFVFESAWFGRYCFTVVGAGKTQEWLAELETFLLRRQTVFASPRRTVNVVIDLENPLPEERLKELIFLCGETNHKLLFVSRGGTTDLETMFEETWAAWPHA